MEGVINPSLAEVLRAGRTDFNQRFKAAQQQYRGLMAEDWLTYVKDTLSPVAEKLAAHDAGSVASVINVLYDQGLSLVGQHWLGAQSRVPVLAVLYRQLLGALAPALAQDPHRLSGSLLNALYQICQHDPRLARTWADALSRIAAKISDVETVLALGVLLAWRAGLPAYRAAALQAGSALPADLAQAALALPAPPDAALWASLQRQPTLTPDDIGRNMPELQWLGWLGGYRGLGGPTALFARRPQIGLAGGKLAASDGEYTWWLAADGFGAQAVRMGTLADWPLNPVQASNTASVRVTADGIVKSSRHALRVTELESADDCVSHGGLLAVTLRTSYQVALLRHSLA